MDHQDRKDRAPAADRHGSGITRRQLLACAGAGLAGAALPAHARPRTPAPPRDLLGYTEYRCNLAGGRHANVITMRAFLVRCDGTGRRPIGASLITRPNTWTQFAGWSPDCRDAIVGVGWETDENAAWEEAHQTFRMTEGWLYDNCLVDVRSGAARNLTAIERVSDYNSGLFFFPGAGGKLGFQALITGVSHPFVMDRDGRNKRDISAGAKGFTYG